MPHCHSLRFATPFVTQCPWPRNWGTFINLSHAKQSAEVSNAAADVAVDTQKNRKFFANRRRTACCNFLFAIWLNKILCKSDAGRATFQLHTAYCIGCKLQFRATTSKSVTRCNNNCICPTLLSLGERAASNKLQASNFKQLATKSRSAGVDFDFVCLLQLFQPSMCVCVAWKVATFSSRLVEIVRRLVDWQKGKVGQAQHCCWCWRCCCCYYLLHAPTKLTIACNTHIMGSPLWHLIYETGLPLLSFFALQFIWFLL